jgi:hypothetical protein
MKRLEAAVTIRAPVASVWQIITDTHLWPVWGPSVKAVRCRDRFITAGSTGFVQTFFGLRFFFEITDFIDETYWSWRVHGINATGHRVEKMSPDKCRLVFDMPVLMAPYWFVCVIALRRIRDLAENHTGVARF